MRTPAGPPDPSGTLLDTSSEPPASRERALLRYERRGLDTWVSPGRPCSYFDRPTLASAPVAAFRSRAVRCAAWGVGLCSPCSLDCSPCSRGCPLCCSGWGARFCFCSCSSLRFSLCSSLRSSLPLAAACSCCGETSIDPPWNERSPLWSALRWPERWEIGEEWALTSVGLCARRSPPRCWTGSSPGAACPTMVCGSGVSCLSSPSLGWSEADDELIMSS